MTINQSRRAGSLIGSRHLETGDRYLARMTVRHEWEYTVTSFPTESSDEGGWIAVLGNELERVGKEGWEVVLKLKDDPGCTHLLLKRPMASS